MIEAVNKGADGLIRFADIRTTKGKTNQPIAHLYPLEVTVFDTTEGATLYTNNAIDSPGADASNTDVPIKLIRDAEKKGREQL